MNPALPALGLSLVLLAGCASTPPAPPADAPAAAAPLPEGAHALVRQADGLLCTAPSRTTGTCVHAAPSDETGFSLFRARALVGDWVELGPVARGDDRPDTCHWMAMLSGFDFVLYAPRDTLQLVLRAPLQHTFDDGTGIRLRPGTPVDVTDAGITVLRNPYRVTVPGTAETGRWFVPAPADKRAPLKTQMLQRWAFAAGDVTLGGQPVTRDAAGATGYVSDEEAAQRKAEAEAAHQALMAKPAAELTEEERKRREATAALAQLNLLRPATRGPRIAADPVVAVTETDPGTVIVTVQDRCLEADLKAPAQALTRHGVHMALGSLGLGASGDTRRVLDEGATVYDAATGAPFGTAQREHTLRVVSDEGGLVCFAQKMFRQGDALTLCADAAAVRTEKAPAFPFGR